MWLALYFCWTTLVYRNDSNKSINFWAASRCTQPVAVIGILSHFPYNNTSCQNEAETLYLAQLWKTSMWQCINQFPQDNSSLLLEFWVFRSYWSAIHLNHINLMNHYLEIRELSSDLADLGVRPVCATNFPQGLTLPSCALDKLKANV